jgi:hypothetical protein
MHKHEFICNKITVLETLLKACLKRESDLSLTEYMPVFQAFFDTAVFPLIQEIKKSGERMEEGLKRRQIVMKNTVADLGNLEEYYQNLKIKNK